MPRKQIECRRRVIELLKKQSYKPEELRKIARIGNRMTLNRILNEFRSYNILNKNVDGEWYFIGLESETDFEKRCKLIHSQKICQGLEQLRDNLLSIVAMNDKKGSLLAASIEHIESGYPKIFNILRDYQKIVSEESGIAYTRFYAAFSSAKLLTTNDFWLMDFEETGKKKLFGRFFSEEQLKRIEVPYAYSFNNPNEALLALEKANVSPTVVRMFTSKEGKCFVLGPIPVQADNEKVSELQRLESELHHGICFLIDQVNLGEQPLKGSCKLCNLT
jgi:hypothetical protein